MRYCNNGAPRCLAGQYFELINLISRVYQRRRLTELATDLSEVKLPISIRGRQGAGLRKQMPDGTGDSVRDSGSRRGRWDFASFTIRRTHRFNCQSALAERDDNAPGSRHGRMGAVTKRSM